MSLDVRQQENHEKRDRGRWFRAPSDRSAGDPNEHLPVLDSLATASVATTFRSALGIWHSALGVFSAVALSRVSAIGQPSHPVRACVLALRYWWRALVRWVTRMAQAQEGGLSALQCRQASSGAQ